MATDRPLYPATLAAQGLHFVDRQSGGIIPGIQPSSTFARDEDYKLLNPANSYLRDHSPTVRQAEAVAAALEGGGEAIAFASGMAAVMAVFLSLPRGSHVVAPSVAYHGTLDRLRGLEADGAITLTLVPAGDDQALAAALKPGETALLWLESPTNPTWDVFDIAAAARAAKAAGALLAVDATVSTPALTRCLDLGADIVFHSATKYLNGHSDLTAGVLVSRLEDELWAKIRAQRHAVGGVLGAFEAWLLQRGLRTLYLRVERASQNALAIAEHFEGHPAVERVLYPGLKSHPGHAVAARQMRGGFGGMLSILVKGGEAEALAVAGRAKVFLRATSLGGVESLIEHRASIEGPHSLVPRNLLRLSVGIEDGRDLIGDLEQALGA